MVKIFALITTLLAAPLWAGEIVIDDAYARVSRPNAPTGAAFLTISNSGAEADRLIAVESDVAKRVELHTHIDAGDGVMQMRQVEDGFEIPAHGMHMLKRGGDHVMLMGLERDLATGDSIDITFVFENAGRIDVMIPVDNERMPNPAAH